MGSHHDEKKKPRGDASEDDDHHFDLADPKLPDWVEKRAFGSGGYPYDEPLDSHEFEATLTRLQIELVKLQTWAIAQGLKVVLVFEGRDAAGKGSVIGALRQYMSPRRTRVIALPKPSDVEHGQWYFQRYVAHLPTAGEVVVFDRSWYNRAGVERVMGFCTPDQSERFLAETPHFEDLLIAEGVHLIKVWLEVGREMQLSRFHDRRHNPLKVWKISDIDVAAIEKFDAYTEARDRMLETTHTDRAPWTIGLGNDKRRLKLNVIRHLLRLFDYPDKDRTVIGEIDAEVLGQGPRFLLPGKRG